MGVELNYPFCEIVGIVSYAAIVRIPSFSSFFTTSLGEFYLEDIRPTGTMPTHTQLGPYCSE